MSSDANYLNFEDPSLDPDRLSHAVGVEHGRRKRTPIPVLPEVQIPIGELRGDPGRRARACVNLRIERVPWAEIVRLLEYDSIVAARADFLRAIASMHRPEEAETMRLLTIANAETLLRRSMAMAGATYLVDMDAPTRKIPNTEQLRWHQQAGQDLNLLATITGVKAPIRVEVTPTEEQYAVLTAAVLQARGITPVVEAEVLELEQLPAEPEDE